MTDTLLFRLLVAQAWQIAVLTAIVAVAAKFLVSRRPQLAHWLWLIVVLKCVTPPLWGHQLGLFSHLQSVMPGGADTDATVGLDDAKWPAVDAEDMSTDIALSVGHSFPAHTTTVLLGTPETLDQDESGKPALVAQSTGYKYVWLVLGVGMLTSFVLLLLRFLSCLRRIHQHRVTEFDDEIGLLVADLSRQLILPRVPRVIVSELRFGPAVLGIFRHLIVLPRCLVADAKCREEKSLRPILAHELMHIRRGDLLTGTLQAAVQCLWWFHPAVWIANRLLSRETERCCDEQVVAELNCSPVEYARSLLAVIECKQNLKPVPVFPGMKPVEITSQRMERIMSLTQGNCLRTPWWSKVALLLFAGVVLPGAMSAQESSTGDLPEAVLPEPDGDSANLADKEPHTPRPKIGAREYPAVGGEASAIASELPVDVDAIAMGDLVTLSIAVSRQLEDVVQIPCRISSDGTLRLPDGIGDDVRVVGLTPLAAAQLIAEKLKKRKIYRDPTVTIEFSHKKDRGPLLGGTMTGTAVESGAGVLGQRVYDECVVQVVGAVTKPGTYKAPRDGEFKLLDALALAGGLVEPVDDSAVLRRRMITGDTSVRLLRIDNIARDGDSNVVLRNGDVVVVEKGKARTKFNLEQEMEDVLSRRISISFKDVPYQDVLQKLAIEAGLNIIFDTRAIESSGNDVPGRKVSLEIKDAEVRKVLDMFCLQLDLTYDVQFDCVRITNSGSAGKGIAFGVRGGFGQPFSKGSNPKLPSHAWPGGYGQSSQSAAASDRDFVVAIVRKLARQFGANIVIEAETLKGLTIPRRDQLTLNFDNVELKAALEEFCGQLGLEHTIEKEVIQIHRRKRFTPIVYNVADLVMPAQTPQSKTAKSAATDGAKFEPLIELIETTVEPGSWSVTGRIVPDKESLSLVIRQTEEVHGQVLDLLSQLRQLQEVKVVTSVVVCRFKTQDQIGRLGRAVEFRNSSEGSKWTLMPRTESVTSLFDPSENEGPVSTSEVATFVGQTANVNLQIPGGSPLRVSVAGVPLAEDKFIRLSYGVNFDGGVETAPPTQATHQVVANGQTLLLDVTNAILRAQVEAESPERSEGSLEASEVVRREKIKLLTRIEEIKRGRIVVAITTSVERQAEAQTAPENPDALRK